MKRATYRKDYKVPKHLVLGIYGRLIPIGWCKWYCDLHKCYLIGRDIKEKRCNKKHCKYLKKLGSFKDIEE